MRLAGKILLAVVLGMPVGVILAMLATPLLWKLEDFLGAELAGHSGPSEWILWSSGIVCSMAVLWLLYRRSAKRA